MINKLNKILEWFQGGESDKGRFRTREFAIVALALVAFAFFFDHQMFIGWFAQTVMLFFKASLAVTFTYCAFRVILHKRNHELQEHEERNRELAQIVGYCIVIGLALST